MYTGTECHKQIQPTQEGRGWGHTGTQTQTMKSIVPPCLFLWIAESTSFLSHIRVPEKMTNQKFSNPMQKSKRYFSQNYLLPALSYYSIKHVFVFIYMCFVVEQSDSSDWNVSAEPKRENTFVHCKQCTCSSSLHWKQHSIRSVIKYVYDYAYDTECRGENPHDGCEAGLCCILDSYIWTSSVFLKFGLWGFFHQ